MPAKTRVVSSLQIGMMIAVRASAAIGSSPRMVEEIEYLSPRLRSSTSRPAIAVQNPAEIQATRIPNSARIAISIGLRPW